MIVCHCLRCYKHRNTLSTHCVLTVEFIVWPFHKTIYEQSEARDAFRLALTADRLKGCIVVLNHRLNTLYLIYDWTNIIVDVKYVTGTSANAWCLYVGSYFHYVNSKVINLYLRFHFEFLTMLSVSNSGIIKCVRILIRCLLEFNRLF